MVSICFSDVKLYTSLSTQRLCTKDLLHYFQHFSQQSPNQVRTGFSFKQVRRIRLLRGALVGSQAHGLEFLPSEAITLDSSGALILL